MDHSYDQVLQAKATCKFLDQIAGEAFMQAVGEPPSDIFGDELNALKRAQLEMDWKNEQVLYKAEESVRMMLGQRASRRRWGDVLDLRAKDKIKYPNPTTSKKIRSHTLDLTGTSPIPLRRLAGQTGEPTNCS